MVIQQTPPNGFYSPREVPGFSATGGQPMPGETSPRFPMSYMAQSTCTAIVSPQRQVSDIVGGEATRYTPGILGRYSAASPPVEGKHEIGEMWYDGYFPSTRPYYPYNGYGPQPRYAPTTIHDPGHRKNATRESTSTLKAWLQEHSKNPYPSKGEKVMLAVVSKMTLTQVSTWFANARRRLKKENKMTWIPKHRPNDTASLASQQSSACDQSSLAADSEIEDKAAPETSCTPVGCVGEASSPIPNTSHATAAILNPAEQQHSGYTSQDAPSMYLPCSEQTTWGSSCSPGFAPQLVERFHCSQPNACKDSLPVSGSQPYFPNTTPFVPENLKAYNNQTCHLSRQNPSFTAQSRSFCQAPAKGLCHITNPPFTQQNTQVTSSSQSQWPLQQGNCSQVVSCIPAPIPQRMSKSVSIASYVNDVGLIRSNEGTYSNSHCSEGTIESTDWYSRKNEDSSPEPQCDLNYGIPKSSWEAPKFGNNVSIAQQQVW